MLKTFPSFTIKRQLGKVQMDAAVMEGKDLNYGGVISIGIRKICHNSRAATNLKVLRVQPKPLTHP